MDKINILPPAVYNLLSAGEVVENPASVVKELVENAIDAGATKISVSITNGGVDEIIVTDNGRGCAESELSKVFLSHATSKIAAAADIDDITSLGFRGEAMSSIAAVGTVEFTSKPAAQKYAVKITNSGSGEITASNDGTTVKVSNLFYNTPARRKFLKSTTTERNNVTAVIHNIVFSHPDLTVKYTADRETILDFRGVGMLPAIREIYDIDTAKMLPLSHSRDGIKIGGFISNIQLSKKNRSRQVVLVNGRPIDGGIIAAAANDVISNYLMVGQYPIFVLTVSIDTAKVDVNVHPQKREVRFSAPDLATAAVRSAVTAALDKYFLSQQSATRSLPTESPRLERVAGKSFDPTETNPKQQEIFLRAVNFIADDKRANMVAGDSSVIADFIRPADMEQEKFELPPQTEQTRVDDGGWRVLGQVFETYLLVFTNENLLIIDQHAMAERINFDKFKAEMDKKQVTAQPLLSPDIIKLSPREQTAVEKIRPLLTAVGFEIDEFGVDAVRVSAIPAVFTAFSCDEFLRAILADREIQTAKLGEILYDRIATMACRASIKAGAVMTDDQIASFIANYQKTNIVPLCPHGRPIMLVYSKSKIENLFGRK